MLRFPFRYVRVKEVLDKNKKYIHFLWNRLLLPDRLFHSLSLSLHDFKMETRESDIDVLGRREKLECIELKPTESIYWNNYLLHFF